MILSDKNFISVSYKKEARKILKTHYGKAVLVSFLVICIVQGFSAFEIGMVHQTEASTLYKNTAVVNEKIKMFWGRYNTPLLIVKVYDGGLIVSILENATKSGSWVFGCLNAANQWLWHDKVKAPITLIVGLIIIVLITILISDVVEVGNKRFFLNLCTANDVKVKDLFFVYKTNCFYNIAKVMLYRNIYLILWMPTIVGFCIKLYSYRLIPYLLAENPTLSKKEIFGISEKLMKGEKRKAFYLDVTFLGWKLLSFLTIGLSDFFFGSSYKEITFSIFYKKLIKKKNIRITNGEIVCWKQTQSYYGKQFAEIIKRNKISGLIIYFFVFSIMGWVWEVAIHILDTGYFVNRGMLHGPWLPVYGLCGLCILGIMRCYSSSPYKLLVACALICGSVEYVTSVLLEVIYKKRWWDYSNILFNINGRVCLEGILFFAVVSWGACYLLTPKLCWCINNIPTKPLNIIATVLVILFLGDLFLALHNPNSGIGITV